MNNSTKLFAKAQTLIPGGVNSPVRAFRGVGGEPLFFKAGLGPYLIDLDNKKYIDLVCSWGPLIAGHAHPAVVEAVQKAVEQGLGFGAPTETEVEMAELITQLVPSIQMVRLCNSGTEATQSAIRLARGFTKRHKILKFEGCYHGHSDSLLIKGGSGLLTFSIPDSAGISQAIAEQTLVAPYNDLNAVRTLFETYGEDIAAIIVEPVAGNMNCVLPLPEFLPGLRQICDEYQALLIFDEIITGFRVALGGAQEYYGVTPDLTCLGKIIGGGLPVGAFGGKKEIMQHLAPLGPVYQAGTLSGNPITLTAGLATLKLLLQSNVYSELSQKSAYLMQHLEKLAKTYGIPVHTVSIGGMFGCYFTEQKHIQNYSDVAKCDVSQFKHFFHGMLAQGIYLAPSAFEIGFVSLVHSQSVLDSIIEAAKRVFEKWTPTEKTKLSAKSIHV